MNLYEATISRVEYGPKVERVPAHGAAEKRTIFPLLVSVTYRANERGIPGFERPLEEDYEFDELAEKSTARLAELERKGALYLSLRETLKTRQIELAELIAAAKPVSIEDSAFTWPDGSDDQSWYRAIRLPSEQSADTAQAPA